MTEAPGRKLPGTPHLDMADLVEHPDDGAGSLDDATLNRALDGAFAAAGDADLQGPASGHNVPAHIGASAGEVPRLTLRAVDASSGISMLKPLGPGEPRPAGKYAIHGLLGSGGVGDVHVGHDLDLGRDVAMKLLRREFVDQPSILRRFVEEAQIGGQLQHPGIVPVYELGTAGERPFFTMKLVEGETLARRLAGRDSPSADRRTFLSIFEDVCQTMAYAHARGVVHRDLKPANIMVGSYGEVQVVDWGMGKVLPQQGVADGQRGKESVVATVRSSGDAHRSELGTVMGTPAYMPPEQARGEVERMDERSDVFALGAILCEILTGKPPYAGRDPAGLLRMAAKAQLGDARERLAGCGGEPELVALAERCLQPAPADRPRTARAVAEVVHGHLAAAEARVHEARVAAAEANVRAQALVRTQRLGIALTVVTAVGLAASLWFWRGEVQAHASEAAARKDAEDHLADFNRLAYVVKLERAKAQGRSFYPAWPEKVGTMRAWLAGEAAELRDALPQLRATLGALAARALPETEEERDASRANHPRAAELANLRAKLELLRRARAVREGRAEPPTWVPDEDKVARDPRQLNQLAWPVVDPDRERFGREAAGLELSRRALAAVAKGTEGHAVVLDTMAWALFAVGLDDEAIARSKEALAVAGERRREECARSLQRLENAVVAARGPGARAEVDRLATRVQDLAARIDERRERRFANPADQFLHPTVCQLATDLESFLREEVPSVQARLRWAERVEELTIHRYRERWEEARLAILLADGVTASRRYAEVPIELSPQLGLVPIGMNPRSKLWEFHHLRSAWDPGRHPDPAALAIPEHDAEGRLDPDGHGVVFVLIPGGRFLMGAQSADPTEPNHDLLATAVERPVHEVQLAPFFLSKYELTQGQWARLSGGEYPSSYKLGVQYRGSPSPTVESSPVEMVSWLMCDGLLRLHGLALPTEAQWEFACRAGTSTPWYTGKAPESLEGHANIRDQTAQNVGVEWAGGESFDDGFKGPAPVGTFAPNPFGLHDVHGNVSEWCRDWYHADSYAVEPRPGDGFRNIASTSGLRTERGGNIRAPARHSRSAHRSRQSPEFVYGAIGVRASRRLDPE